MITDDVSRDAPLGTRRSLLRRINRSRLVALVLALAFPLVMIRAGRLLSRSQLQIILEMPLSRFGRFSPPIFSLVHGRPLEVCPSVADDERVRYLRIHEQYRTARGVRALLAMSVEYHRTSRELMLRDCTVDWEWQPGSGSHLYAQFARDAPIAWIFKRLNGSEVFIGLFVLISAVMGSYGLARIVRFLSESNLVLALALGVFAWTVWLLFRVFGLNLLWAFYGLLTCWLVASWNRRSSRCSFITAAIFVALLAVHLTGYLVVAYSAAVGPIALAIGAMFMSVLARPSRRRILQLIAVTAFIWMATWDCAAFSKRQLAPVTTLNFAGSGSFGDFALSTGFWTERPSPVSFPLGDGGVYAASLAEPLTQRYANFIYEYQGFEAFGRTLLAATILRHPVTALESFCKRLFIFVVKFPAFVQPLSASNPGLMRVAQAGIIVTPILACMVLRSRSRWDVELPLTLIPLWNVYGIEMLTHVIHTHSAYFLFGIMQLMLLGPALLLAALRGGSPSFLPPRSVGSWRRIALVLLGGVLITVLSFRGVRRELRTFDIWYHPWIGMYTAAVDRESLEPGSVAAKVERLRALGEQTPGSISMYGVWTMSRLATNVWTPAAGVGQQLGIPKDEVDRRRGAALALAREYFHRAQIEAPDDPWIHSFAYLWDPGNVSGPYARLLRLYPQHPFAAMWAYELINRTAGSEQQRYADLFDELTHRHLARTVALRPGFERRPPVSRPTSVREELEGEELHLNGGDVALVGSARTFDSNRLGLLVYVRAVSGSSYACLEVQTDRGVVASPEQRVSPSDVQRFRMFRWNGATGTSEMRLRIRTDPGGSASVRVRDFYPLIENPHVSVASAPPLRTAD